MLDYHGSHYTVDPGSDGAVTIAEGAAGAAGDSYRCTRFFRGFRRASRQDTTMPLMWFCRSGFRRWNVHLGYSPRLMEAAGRQLDGVFLRGELCSVEMGGTAGGSTIRGIIMQGRGFFSGNTGRLMEGLLTGIHLREG